MSQRPGNLALIALLACVFTGNVSQRAYAQTSGGGVIVDAEGVMKMQQFDPHLDALRAQQALQNRDPNVNLQSPLRKVSLNRLEAAIVSQLDAGLRLSSEMRQLAGLTRLQYVMLYPESGDIVIAGPAEHWFEDQAGHCRGVKSGRPTIELQDLIVAMRAYAPGKRGGPLVGCSIDPTQDGLIRMQKFLQGIGGRATPRDTHFIVNGLQTSLGLQTVRVMGVQPDTHFAQVMVEADYRMKLIGIGLERPPVKIGSYAERANPSQVSRNALQRWFFTPDYACLRVSDDALAMELVGEGVKLIGEDELVGADGRRQAVGVTNRASQVFVSTFTKKYPELAARSPIYAQLRNLIDLLVAAAFMQQNDYYGQANWRAEILLDEEKVPVRTFKTPKQVPTAVNSIWKGNRLMTPVGGGVHIEADRALRSDSLLSDEGHNVRANAAKSLCQAARQRSVVVGLTQGRRDALGVCQC